jgi:hypothetical protein
MRRCHDGIRFHEEGVGPTVGIAVGRWRTAVGALVEGRSSGVPTIHRTLFSHNNPLYYVISLAGHQLLQQDRQHFVGDALC